MSTQQLLLIRVGSLQLGLRASTVTRIVPEADWEGPPPAELEPLFRVTAEESSARHVLLVQGKSGTRAVRVSGALELRSFEEGEVQALPDLLFDGQLRQLVSSVVASHESPPVLVLCPQVLDEDVAAI